MKRLCLTVFLCFALFLLLPLDGQASGTPANFSGGSGTESDPYIISTAQDLASVADRISSGRENNGHLYASAHYLQTTDINLSSIDNWLPIGVNEKQAFYGVYDGGGYKISNPRYSDDTGTRNFESYGLFGIVSGDALLRGIKIENAFSNVYDARISTFGVIVGYIASGTVRECSSAGDGISFEIISHSARKRKALREVGGIVGKMISGDILDCVNRNGFAISSDVSTLYVGGIIGRFENGTLENCGNEGTINLFGTHGNVGGIAGFESGGKSINCSNFGDIRLMVSRGAIAGGIHAGSSGIILRCINTGNVEIRSAGRMAHAGGLVGWMYGKSVEESMNVGSVLAEVECNWEEYKKTYLSFDNTDSVSKERIESIRPEIKVGGLIASMRGGYLVNTVNKGVISGKILAGNVSSDVHLGGLAGAIDLPGYIASSIPDYAVIQDSFNTGIIRYESQSKKTSCAVGGIVGFSNVKVKQRNRLLSWIFGNRKEKNKISGCYWLDEAGATQGVGRYEYPGQNPKDDTIALTAEEFKIQNTFIDWDFKDIWAMPSKDVKMPVLRALQKWM